MGKRSLDTHTEIQVVAMVARGDTYDDISKFLATKEYAISPATLTVIKKRNAEALSFMTTKMVEHETNRASDILAKSQKALENKLDTHIDLKKSIRGLGEQYHKGEIDEQEYGIMLDNLHRDARITPAELTTISKEMFNQSQILSGKPTNITDNPNRAKENVQRMLSAIKSGDEEKMIDALFLGE